MEIDPLGETLPPRHTVESDEEEDEFNPLSARQVSLTKFMLDIGVHGRIPVDDNLLFASGEGAAFWREGVDLGGQIGAVSLNGITVGVVFKPVWTKATIVVSETASRLPTWAMHMYTGFIIDNIKPTRVALLDTYAAKTYIVAEPVPYDDAPLRYLSNLPLPPHLPAFSPPNLMSTTSASLLSALAIRSIKGTPTSWNAIILPSSQAVPQPSHDIASFIVSRSSRWSPDVMSFVHKFLLQSLGEHALVNWTKNSQDESILPRGEYNAVEGIGEGGMYI